VEPVSTEAVSAVIVTRGNVDLRPVLDSLPPAWQQVIWDNSLRPVDRKVMGRYLAIAECEHDLIYVQDDDCVLAAPNLLVEAWWREATSDSIVCNMPEEFRPYYPDSALVGFGAVFERSIPDTAFGLFELHHQLDDDVWDRCCDVIVTALTPRQIVNVPKTNLPWAEDADRMYKQPTHFGERQHVLKLARNAR